MGNVIGITCCTCNLAECTLANINPSTCLPRTDSFRSLQNDWDRLSSQRSDILNKIELEEREHKRRRLQIVVEWLSKVDSIETQFRKLETDYVQQSANYKCFCTRNGYKLGKKVAHVRQEVVSLLERKPEVVAQNILIAEPAERPVGPMIGLQSILDQAWFCFQDARFSTIGLYGMGGVGKTTLLKQLNNMLCRSNQRLFDVLLWIVVSTNPNLTTIQNDIGEKLGFHSKDWMEKRQEEKASDIYNDLKGKKYVLFLDDVWKRFDLLELGVPLPNETNDSRVVLTTRSYQVCCEMEVKKKIEVTCLEEDEAWNLFREKVGENTINANPEIQEIAKLVAKECAGLPLALVVIGRAMASKRTLRAWSNALDRLKRNYSTEITGTGDQILPQLKFSYDSLSNDSIRSCFLYCSLYPEDDVIEKNDIIDKWICEGFLNRFVDLHEARNEGYEYIDTLVNASLLEESSYERFKMHDIIREMAIWIGCECGEIKNKFFVRAGVGLTETPNLGECEASKRMSLMGNKIDKLNGKPNCPNLETLFLNRAGIVDIDNEFFQSMGKLRVLDLSKNNNLKEIPEEVCNLITLQYLNLTNLIISKLPINLRKLINLKCFLVSNYTRSIQLPECLLSSFKKLQVLHLLGKVVLPETFVEEIESLNHLNDLRIQLSTHDHFESSDDDLLETSADDLPESSDKGLLESNDDDLPESSDEDLLDSSADVLPESNDDVHLESNDDVLHSRFSSSHKLATITTELQVRNLTSSNLDLLVSHKMVNLKDLHIGGCRQLEYVISSEIKNYNYMNNLRILTIYECQNLKDITLLVFTSAPNLESIGVSNCEGMKELCGEWDWEEEHTTPFPKLKTLQLYLLDELERIYPTALPALFPCLKELRISNCPKLKKLPFNSTSCNSGSGVFIECQDAWWKQLEWEDEATRIAFLHSFNCCNV